MTEDDPGLEKAMENLRQFLESLRVPWELSNTDKRFLRALRISPK